MYQINLSSPRLFYQGTTLGQYQEGTNCPAKVGLLLQEPRKMADLARAAKFPCNKCENKFDSKIFFGRKF